MQSKLLQEYDEKNTQMISNLELVELDVDVLIPAALQNQITKKNADNINKIKSGKFKIISAYNALNNISSIEIYKEYINHIKNGKKINNLWFKDKVIFNKIKDEYYKFHNKKKLLAIVKIINGNFKYDLVY